jgi:hypothetical protein
MLSISFPLYHEEISKARFEGLVYADKTLWREMRRFRVLTRAPDMYHDFEAASFAKKAGIGRQEV